MRYVKRNDQGLISAVFDEPVEGASEGVPRNDPALLAFVTEGGGERAMRRYLASVDDDLMVIVEDLIDIFIDKGELLLSDFPEETQHRLTHRRKIRQHLMNY